MARLDINKNGIISREDYEIMSERLSKYSNLTEKQAKEVHDALMSVADSINLKPGIEHKLEEYAPKLSQMMLSKAPKERDISTHRTHSSLFDAIDTNKDGHISVKEYTIYLKVIAPDVTEDEAKHAFDVIDQDKNGEISREELIEAAKDFLFGVEETEISKVFFGKLLD